MAGDEEQIGVAQFSLEAEYKALEEGLNRVKQELEKGEASFAKFTQKGEREGARLLAAEQRIDREIVALKENTTQRQLRLVDERTAREVQRAMDRGVELEKIGQLEIAAMEKKHRILVAEELKAASVRTEAIQKSSLAVVDAKLKTEEFGQAMRLAGLGSEKISAGLKLLDSTAGPLAITIGAVSTELIAYAKKVEVADRANREFLRTAREMDQRLRDLAIQAKVAAGDAGDAEAEKLRTRIEKQQAVVEEGMRRLVPLEDSWKTKLGRWFSEAQGSIPIITDLSLALGAQLTDAADDATQELAKEQLVLEGLNKELKEHLKLVDADAAKVKAAEAAKQHGLEQEVPKSRNAMDVELKKEAAEVSDSEAKARKEVAGAEERETEQILLALKHLERQRDLSERQVELEQEATKAVRERNIELARTVSLSTSITGAQARGIANDLYNAGYTQAEIARRLNEMGIDPGSIGFGRGIQAGPAAVRQNQDPLEALFMATRPFSGAFIYPGFGQPAYNPLPALSNPVTVQVNNYGSDQVRVKQGGGGQVVIEVAGDILNGGDVTRALEERYGLQPGGGH